MTKSLVNSISHQHYFIDYWISQLGHWGDIKNYITPALKRHMITHNCQYEQTGIVKPESACLKLVKFL